MPEIHRIRVRLPLPVAEEEIFTTPAMSSISANTPRHQPARVILHAIQAFRKPSLKHGRKKDAILTLSPRRTIGPTPHPPSHSRSRRNCENRIGSEHSPRLLQEPFHDASAAALVSDRILDGLSTSVRPAIVKATTGRNGAKNVRPSQNAYTTSGINPTCTEYKEVGPRRGDRSGIPHISCLRVLPPDQSDRTLDRPC